jgi:hypothetical protein
MKVFLAGGNGKEKIIPMVHGVKDGNERLSCEGHTVSSLYRSDIILQGISDDIAKYRPYILESFYYANEETEKLLPYFGDFLLDSGAFTFMAQARQSVNWNEYAERYADFIIKNNIQKYIELDLDYIIGVEGARNLRRYLEKKTGKQSLPVWHPIRGTEEFLRMCDEYSYVCLGGIVGQK